MYYSVFDQEKQLMKTYDHLSSLLFIFYQAKTIKQIPDQMEEQNHEHQFSDLPLTR